MQGKEDGEKVQKCKGDWLVLLRFNSLVCAFAVAVQANTILRAILNLHVTTLETHDP